MKEPWSQINFNTHYYMIFNSFHYFCAKITQFESAFKYLIYKYIKRKNVKESCYC